MRVSKSTQRCLAFATVVLASMVFAAVGAWADFSTSVPNVTAQLADGKGSSPHDVQTYTPMLSWQFNDADAGDAFSSFCEDLWRGIAEFRGDASFKTWAYKLAWHAALRNLRDPHKRLRRALATNEA